MKKLGLLISLCLVIAAFTTIVYAEDSVSLKVNNNNILTNDVNATYIEGSVPMADGQTIIVKRGLRNVAEKTLPRTGAPASFRIKVPADTISQKRVTVLHVQQRYSDDNATVQASDNTVRVEINYKEREKQNISTDKKEYEMTYPGLDETLVAEASSGDKLIYTSSDPEVAEIDSKGKIVTKGPGEATISVKQIGNGTYDEAQKDVKVAVEAIDAYTVTYHSSDDKNKTVKQVVPIEGDNSLDENSFENGNHEFLGWASEDGGLVEYTDAEPVAELAEKGENKDLYAVWSGDGANAAVAWAIKIANDDSFTYGKKPETNRIGCYFCGTNQRNKPRGYEKTYVCLTFVAAAYAHGAEDPEVYYACSHGKMPLYENDKNFSQFSCWKKIGSCASLTVDDLQPGDVLIKWSAHSDNSGHTCMYAGNGDIVESSGGGWSANSIALKEGAAAGRLRAYSGNSRNYVMRYVGANAQN